MPISKNKGPLLTTHILGSVQNFPKEYLAKIGLDIFVQQVPLDIGVDALTGLLVESKVEQERTDERKKTNTFLTEPPNLNPLISEVKLESGLTGTRTKQLVPDPTALIVNNLTETADQVNLGNDFLDQTIVQAPSLFSNITSSRELTDNIPDIFKALIPIFGHEETVFGTVVDPPILSPGDIYKSEDQIDIFTKRVTTKGRAGVTLPQTITLLRHLGGFEFGGGITEIIGLLTDVEPSVESGLTIISSEVRNLGAGTWFRSTEKLEPFFAVEWPELIGTEVDPRTGIVITVKRKVVDAGTTGGVDVNGYTDIKPIDKWKSLQIVSKLDPTSLPASRTWETTAEHSFPNTLLSANWVFAEATAPFASDFDIALLLNMEQGYAGPCRAKVTESYSNGPPGGSVSITQFFPQGHMIGFAWFFAADPGDECGTCIGIARASARTWSVPPSLHPTITVTGGPYSATMPATTPTGLPAAGTLITKSVDVEPWRFGVFYKRLVQIYVP